MPILPRPITVEFAGGTCWKFPNTHSAVPYDCYCSLTVNPNLICFKENSAALIDESANEVASLKWIREMEASMFIGMA